MPRPRVSVFIACSLDGFIARKDGAIDWLMTADKVIPDGEDLGTGAFMASVDTIVMGRESFEKVMTFDGWFYGAMPVVVMSRSMAALPERTPATVTLSSESPAALLDRLAAQGVTHVWVDGGRLIAAFMAEGLVDRLTITTIPVLIGEGRPLFHPLGRDCPMRLVESRTTPFSYVQTVWEPA